MKTLELFKIFLTLVHNQFKWRLQQKSKRRLRPGRTAMEELEKIINGKDMSLDTKAKVIYILILPITMYKCKTWTLKKADRRKKIEKNPNTLIHLKNGIRKELDGYRSSPER